MSTVSLAKLQFDTSNPRFENVKNQRDALQTILADEPKKVLRLAEHISSAGLSPIDNILAVKASDGDFVVVEGNRRLAALKLLSKPSLVDSLEVPASIKKQFKKLGANFRIADLGALPVKIVDADEARQWIELKHTGENEGAGVVPWDGYATARFRGSSLALQAIEFARTESSFDKDVEEKLGSIYITNVDRLLGDPYVRSKLGLTKDGKKLVSTKDRKPVATALARVIADIATGQITVTKIKTKDLRKKYIDDLHEVERIKKASDVDAWSLIGNEKNGTSAALKSAKKRPLRAPNQRLHLIPSNCVLQIPQPRINAIYRELAKVLRFDRSPNAIAVLLRVFLELTCDHYIKSHKLRNVSVYSELKTKVVHVCADLETKQLALSEQLKPVRAATHHPDGKAHASTLHAFVHNLDMNPISADLISAWNSLQPFFEIIWCEAKKS